MVDYSLNTEILRLYKYTVIYCVKTHTTYSDILGFLTTFMSRPSVLFPNFILSPLSILFTFHSRLSRWCYSNTIYSLWPNSLMFVYIWGYEVIWYLTPCFTILINFTLRISEGNYVMRYFPNYMKHLFNATGLHMQILRPFSTSAVS